MRKSKKDWETCSCAFKKDDEFAQRHCAGFPRFVCGANEGVYDSSALFHWERSVCDRVSAHDSRIYEEEELLEVHHVLLRL